MAETLLALALIAIFLIGRWFFRTWFAAEIERRVQHAFDAQLESIRSELRIREGEIAALRDRVLSGRTTRQGLLDKRRLDAVDGIWAAAMALDVYRAAVNGLSVLDIDKLEEAAAKEPKVRQFIELVTINLPDLNAYSRMLARKEQPFVSEIVWAFFVAYEAVILSIVHRATLLKAQIPDAHKLFNKAGIASLVKAALPEKAELIDQIDKVHGYHVLIEHLEDRLRAEISKMLDGAEMDDADMKKAATIIDQARKLNEATKE